MKDLWTASYVLVVIMIFVTSKKYFNNKHLYKKVSWCMTERKKGSCQIFTCLWSQQYDLPDLYRLKKAEEHDAAFILDAFQDALSESYFSGRLAKSSKALGLTEEEYFFLSMRNFLSEHECEISLNGVEKYSLLEKTNYGVWGSQLYDAKYQLTAFGVVYTKLLYCVCLYCEANIRISKLKIPKEAVRAKERIDSGVIEISVL